MKRKITLVLVVCVIAAAMLAGCSNVGNNPSMSPSISPMLSPSPSTSPTTDSSGTPGLTASPDPVGADTQSSNNEEAASAIKAEVDKLSEVSESYAVVLGNVALIGVKFDGQYQGGVTERINEMVAEKVSGVDDQIVDVIVTDAQDTVSKIQELADRNGQNIKDDFTDIVNQLKPAAQS